MRNLSLERALHQIRATDDLWNKTYSVVQDPKLFIPLLEKIKLSFLLLIHVLDTKKRSEEATLVYFTTSIAPKQGLSPHYAKAIEDITSILQVHSMAKTQFVRHGSLVLCTEEFKIFAIEPKSIQNYINLSKNFYTAVEKIIS